MERILHQTEVKPEAPLELPERKPAEGWPSSGEVEFRSAYCLFWLIHALTLMIETILQDIGQN